MEGERLNWTGRVARFFVENGRLSLLILLALFAWGVGSYATIPGQYNPRITAPAFQIRVEYPGASQQEILEQVTRPLENVVSDIPGVDDIYSVTEQGGRAIVTVNFYVGEDPQAAKTLLADRIRSNLHLAPLGIREPAIQSIDPDDVPVLTIALTSDELGAVALRKAAFRLRDRLRTVPEAANIDVVGGRKRELAIRVDPNRLAANGIGIESIARALQASNVYLPAGEIKTDLAYIPLETTGTVQRPEDLRNLIVVTGDFGQTRLHEVATVSERIQEVESHVHHIEKLEGGELRRHEAVVLLSVARLKDSNISDVTERIERELIDLRKHFIPSTIEARVIVNEGQTASEEINRLMQNLITAILIVVAILLLFLDRRAALLVAVSIPLTLLSVFGVGYLAGQTINRITLFALILSLGLLVDNATVVTENIVRWLREKSASLENRRVLIVRAVAEVGPGLVMSTITTVLAFIPMAFVTGMMGPYMGPIPFFVPTALVLALVISLSINPWLASVVLKSSETRTATSALSQRIESILSFEFILKPYQKHLHGLLVDTRKRRIALATVLGLLLLSLSLPAVKLVKFRMLPKADRKQFFLYVDLPAGTPLEDTNRVARAYEELLMQEPEVTMVQTYVGTPPILDFNGLFRGVSARNESYQATLRVGLTHPDERAVESADLVARYRERLEKERPRISPTRSVRLKLVEDPPGPPVLSTLLVRIQGHDAELLQSIARELEPIVANTDQVVDTDTSVLADTETIDLTIDSARASRSRVSVEQIAQTMRIAYDGQVLGFYHSGENIEQEYITLRLARSFREDPATLSQLFLVNDLGIKVPLVDLVRIERHPTHQRLLRENRQMTAYVYGEMGQRSITYAAIDLLYFLSDYRLPNGMGEMTSMDLFGAEYRTRDGERVQIELGGEWELTLEVFRDLGLAMGGAIFLVYVVLVAQFGSFREALIILATVPLGLIGVMPGFMILGFTVGLYFNATSMIGVIALAGIAVNNSIILLEYLNSMKLSGKSLEVALVEAGTTRFRPILLTTATTILGSLTIVGDPVWAGLAWAIVFGLGVSSLLTLIVFPVLYRILKGDDWPSVA